MSERPEKMFLFKMIKLFSTWDVCFFRCPCKFVSFYWWCMCVGRSVCGRRLVCAFQCISYLCALRLVRIFRSLAPCLFSELVWVRVRELPALLAFACLLDLAAPARRPLCVRALLHIPLHSTPHRVPGSGSKSGSKPACCQGRSSIDFRPVVLTRLSALRAQNKTKCGDEKENSNPPR